MLYPVFGTMVFGRLGDIVDSISIICISFGVATSFILGAIKMVAGAKFLFPELEDTRSARFENGFTVDSNSNKKGNLMFVQISNKI